MFDESTVFVISFRQREQTEKEPNENSPIEQRND